MEEVANDVMHPISKETIIKYEKKLISDRLLWENWMKGMWKDIGRFSQGYGERGTDEYVRSTNTVLFMDLDNIKIIATDQVVAYSQLVVGYQPKKKRIQIVWA